MDERENPERSQTINRKGPRFNRGVRALAYNPANKGLEKNGITKKEKSRKEIYSQQVEKRNRRRIKEGPKVMEVLTINRRSSTKREDSGTKDRNKDFLEKKTTGVTALNGTRPYTLGCSWTPGGRNKKGKKVA